MKRIAGFVIAALVVLIARPAAAYGWTSTTDAYTGAWGASYVSPSTFPNQMGLGLGGHGTDPTSFVEFVFYDDALHPYRIVQDLTANGVNVYAGIGVDPQGHRPPIIGFHIGTDVGHSNTWKFTYASNNYATLV